MNFCVEVYSHRTEGYFPRNIAWTTGDLKKQLYMKKAFRGGIQGVNQLRRKSSHLPIKSLAVRLPASPGQMS